MMAYTTPKKSKQQQCRLWTGQERWRSVALITGGLLDPLRDAFDWDEATFADLRGKFSSGGLVAAWELQSQLATIALLALVTVVSVVSALAVMIAWSLCAAILYSAARKRGLPDLLESTSAPRLSGTNVRLLIPACLGLLKAWLAGVQAFIFSRTACRVFSRPAQRWQSKMLRISVLGVGLTLFGVPAADHMLRTAGYKDARLLRLSLLAPFLNVPYRVLLSTLIVNALLGIARRPFL